MPRLFAHPVLLNVRMDVTLLAWVQRRAREEHLSASALARKYLEEAAQREGMPEETPVSA